MPRLHLDIPEHLSFQTEIPLRITDMNYVNHLGNDRLLTLMHEVRAQFFHDLGMTEMDAEGTGFVVADAAMVFKAEGFYPSILVVEVGTGDLSRVSFDMYYRFRFKESGKVMAYGKTGMVCFDHDTHKIRSMPQKLRDILVAKQEVNA